MKKSSLRKMLAMVMAICLLLTTNVVDAKAATVTVGITTIEEQKIEAVIYSFFISFENVEESGSREQIMSELTALSTADTLQIYQVQESASVAEVSSEESYLEMAQLLLERREIIENTADIDLKEHKKEIQIETKALDVRGNVAEADVRVVRTWYYSFSPDIESGASDDLHIVLVKEMGDWKIQDIDGLSTIVMDPEIMKLGDSITRKEREEYISSVEEIFAYDLNHPVITEKADARMESADTVEAEIDPKGYSMQDAIDYALEYALEPNPDFPVFEVYDGTNFVSQCLLAGGVPMKYGTWVSYMYWYFIDEHDYSATWTDPDRLCVNLMSTDTICNSAIGNWATVGIGDIVHLMLQGQAFHTMFITGVAYNSTEKSDLLVCCHNEGRRHVSMMAYFGSDIKNYTLIRGNL